MECRECIMRNPSVLGVLLFSVLASAAFAQTGDVEERLKGLEKRLENAEKENRSLQAEVERLKSNRPAKPSTKGTASPEGGEGDLDKAIEDALARQAAKDKAVSWSSATVSGTPIQFYGFVRLDYYYNTARMNSVIIPVFVLPENGTTIDHNNNQAAFDARLTRLGLNINAGEVVGADMTGKLEIDFANYTAASNGNGIATIRGTPESRATPRMRLAYLNADWGAFNLRAGQDWDTISPLYPSVNAEMLMWYAGNLGDRRPQVRGTWRFGGDDGIKGDLAVAAGLTGAIDNQDFDVRLTTPKYTSTERDGFDSGAPNVQTRFGLAVAGAKLGVWGFASWMTTDASFGGSSHFHSYGLGIDFMVPLGDVLSLKGEGWIGQALTDWRGGAAQTINFSNGREVKAMGGWAEAQIKVSDVFRFALGGSIDDPDNSLVNPGAPDLNYTLYVGTVQNWASTFKTGLDVIYWQTDWDDSMNTGGTGTAVRLDVYTQLNF